MAPARAAACARRLYLADGARPQQTAIREGSKVDEGALVVADERHFEPVIDASHRDHGVGSAADEQLARPSSGVDVHGRNGRACRSGRDGRLGQLHHILEPWRNDGRYARHGPTSQVLGNGTPAAHAAVLQGRARKLIRCDHVDRAVDARYVEVVLRAAQPAVDSAELADAQLARGVGPHAGHLAAVTDDARIAGAVGPAAPVQKLRCLIRERLAPARPCAHFPAVYRVGRTRPRVAIRGVGRAARIACRGVASDGTLGSARITASSLRAVVRVAAASARVATRRHGEGREDE